MIKQLQVALFFLQSLVVKVSGPETLIEDHFSESFFTSSTFQPAVTVTPKSIKNGKPGYDDTTLPLMEKNQGQC